MATARAGRIVPFVLIFLLVLGGGLATTGIAQTGVGMNATNNSSGNSSVTTETPRGTIISDYNFENKFRGPGGRIDDKALINRLVELGVNHYFYLIWHRASDWKDFQEFARLAQQHNIKVWAHVVPPSGSTQSSFGRDSQPFRFNYERWAAETARLKNQYPVVQGLAIDDAGLNLPNSYGSHRGNSFNPTFTPRYLQSVRQSGRSVNGNFRLAATIYEGQFSQRFVRDYGSSIDVLMFAYPDSTQEIRRVASTTGNAMDLLMIAAVSKKEYRNRHEDAPTLANRRAKLQMSVEMVNQGVIDGVQTYGLDKTQGSQMYVAVQSVYQGVSPSNSPGGGFSASPGAGAGTAGGGGGGFGLPSIDIPDPKQIAQDIWMAGINSVTTGIGSFVDAFNKFLFPLPVPGEAWDIRSMLTDQSGFWPGVWFMMTVTEVFTAVFLTVQAARASGMRDRRKQRDRYKQIGKATIFGLAPGVLLLFVFLHPFNTFLLEVAPSGSEFLSTPGNAGRLGIGLVLGGLLLLINAGIVGLGIAARVFIYFSMYVIYWLWGPAWALTTSESGNARNVGYVVISAAVAVFVSVVIQVAILRFAFEVPFDFESAEGAVQALIAIVAQAALVFLALIYVPWRAAKSLIPRSMAMMGRRATTGTRESLGDARQRLSDARERIEGRVRQDGPSVGSVRADGGQYSSPSVGGISPRQTTSVGPTDGGTSTPSGGSSNGGGGGGGGSIGAPLRQQRGNGIDARSGRGNRLQVGSFSRAQGTRPENNALNGSAAARRNRRRRGR